MTVEISCNNKIPDLYRVDLPPSKSASHRALICAALAGEASVEGLADKADTGRSCIAGLADNDRGGSVIEGLADNDDIRATAAALKAFCAAGAEGELRADCSCSNGELRIDCGESGTTLRFLLPLLAQSGRRCVFTGRGRLLDRPLEVYEKIYKDAGAYWELQKNALIVQGGLKPGRFEIPGNISSQFVSGLLFLLPTLDGDSEIVLTTPLQSAPYAMMTIDVLQRAGVEVQPDGSTIRVPGRQKYKPFSCRIEGDWSSAANIAVLSALTGVPAELKGADPQSHHPDRAVLEFIRMFKAGTCNTQTGPHALHAIQADISSCPDLGPLLFAMATQADGTSVFTGVSRLRLKESDRIASMQQELAKLGFSMEVSGSYPDETVLVQGKAAAEQSSRAAAGQSNPAAPADSQPRAALSGHGDHRIVMALSVLAAGTGRPVSIEGAEAVTKSWPAFFEALQSCGAAVTKHL